MNWEQHTSCPQSGEYLCSLTDIPNGGGFEVTFGPGKENFKILLLREDEQYWCYLNHCPHFSLPLNYKPQKFIISKGRVVCAHHTAFFNISDGNCVDGPCTGKALTKLPSYCVDQKIYFGSLT